VIIILSRTDLISYGLPWYAGRPGVVVLRALDQWPLTMPLTPDDEAFLRTRWP
jgi:hypothetical protein